VEKVVKNGSQQGKTRVVNVLKFGAGNTMALLSKLSVFAIAPHPALTQK
jgi:hypothetical protein